MSFVECMECGDRLGGVTANHLKKHRLTTRQYRRKYPAVPMVSENHGKILRTAALNRQLKRICRECGKPFTTRCPKAHYCHECQRVRRAIRQRRYARRYERRARNSGKDNKLGTFRKRYLEVENGRIQGATLLQRHISANEHSYRRSSFNGSAPSEYEANCLVIICQIIIYQLKICIECGSKLVVARENEYYTIPAEICCKRCGSVYELT